MSENGHDLHALFPAHGEILHALKLESGQFRTLADQHHQLVQEIDRIDSGLEAASDERVELLKKQRLGVLDEIAALVARRTPA